MHEQSSAAAAQIEFARERLGASIAPGGGRVIDFGCGDGRSVAELRSLGFDAWGTDIHIPDTVVPDTRGRLRLAEQVPFRLPFEDETFDFVFSDQVMEHVEDLVAVFRELIRVMKPGALSTHRFPGPLCPFDGAATSAVP